MGRNRDMSPPQSPLDELMADIEFFRNQQNFEPQDSLLGSALAHPIEAVDRFTDNIRLAQGRQPKYGADQGVYGPTELQQIQGASNVAGSAMLGSIPLGPKGAGTLGSIPVLHGSPTKFTKMSNKYPNKGIGGQQSGHGMYGGENAKNLDIIARKNLIEGDNPGYMYELDWKPDQKDIMHFDKKVGEHPEPILSALRSFGKDTDSAFTAYRKMQKELGKGATTDYLLERGIPGHSTPSGYGYNEYIMYSPDDVKTIRRIRGGLDNPSPKARQSILDYTGKDSTQYDTRYD
ncbi:MAG: hypothetical protein DRQ39_10900 [Gammaproteobacteria bacterium]|nr:MAG: hypothetical protein DRQ39_10900 [Gammaproteobacteria bacterium]